MTNRLLKAEEIAQILNVSKAQAFLMMRRGDLPVVRMGRLVRVRQEDLDQFVIDNVTNFTTNNKTRLAGTASLEK